MNAALRAAGALASVAAGTPVVAALVLGRAPFEWPVPFEMHLTGDAALRTAVYLPGFLFFFGLIELYALARRVGRADESRGGIAARRNEHDPGPMRHRRSHRAGLDPEDSASGEPPVPVAPIPDEVLLEGPTPLAEPLYGFLSAPVQRRLARETGYHALLFSRISILFTAAVGILLAGSWQPVSITRPLEPAAAVRALMGLYLIAESVHRYARFAKGEPSGTLVGTALYAAFAPFRREENR